jgi:anti-sigma B factor antagonist
MYYKLTAINDISFSLCRKIHFIEEQLLHIFHLATTYICKSRSTQVHNTASCTQHLQYEIMYLDGEINMSNSTRMKKEILKIISNKKSILLDFTKLHFIDSSGIATLIETLHKANALGLNFVIVGANNLPLKMLELSQLDNVFKLFNSIHEVKL